MKPATGFSISSLNPGKGHGLLPQEIEEIPLRHHGDEGRGRFEVREVANRPFAPGESQDRLVEPVVRARQKAVQHAELVEDLHRRRVDRVAAEIAKEIGMLFEDPDLAAGTGEQQARHHPCRPAADNDQIGIAHRRSLESESSQKPRE
jgi:hypothetical protein